MLPSIETRREVIAEELSDQKRSDLGEDFARLQRALNKTEKSMLVIVDGWESSGKGTLLKDLTRELDPKYYEVSVFEESTEEENRHPYLHRFFMRAPYEGQISFFDRSFYYDLLNNPELENGQLAHLIDDIQFVEDALAKNDTLIVKFFLHQTKEEMQKNIEDLEEDSYRHVRLSDNDYDQLQQYEKYYHHFKSVLDQTNNPLAPWNVLYVEGEADTSRKALEICIDRLDLFLDTDTKRKVPELKRLPDADELPLDQVDLTKEISEEEYDRQLEDLQKRAGDLLYQVYIEGKTVVVAYEGTDAAGKGGNIERLTRYMDPRGYDVATVSAPTKHEAAHHYLWRFYRDFPPKGRMTIFDRSWYGRVLVERVDELTPEYRWKEAYEEINQMEHNLVHEGYLVLKYLLIIDKEEQRKRFEARAEDPDKQHKLTDADWESHEKFEDYKQAMNEMVFYTSTEEAPWKIVSGMDKKYARIQVLRDFIEKVSAYLEDE
ncbi:MAG TPA: phosphate:AMP phosphotransferase [Atopostipes sp.]|nr:phosphate:AMP phosphotransferase [Atopostipes sp.]